MAKLRGVQHLVVWILAWGVVHLAVAANIQPPVGQVLMQVGQAWVQRVDTSTREPLQRAMALYEGDRITTGSNSFVQLKMHDDAMVMIQPDTHLQLQVYRYHPDQPKANRIRLYIFRGQVRWITGKAAQLNKAGFRLNTPVAAIGIRGTDFTTSVLPDKTTHVRLYHGAVVVSPLGEDCTASAYGPCEGDAAVILDEQRKDMIVEIRPGNRKPLLRKSSHQRPDNGVGGLSPVTGEDNPRPAPRLVPGREAIAASQSLQWGRYAATPVESWPDAATLIGQGWTPQAATNHLLLFNRQDFVSLPRGKASFNLEAAEAYLFANDQSPVSVPVLSGRLNVDFDRKTFATSLTLLGETGGERTLDAQGALRNNGLFYSHQGTMQVKGTFDGSVREAAYLFSAPGQHADALEGATYWRR